MKHLTEVTFFLMHVMSLHRRYTQYINTCYKVAYRCLLSCRSIHSFHNQVTILLALPAEVTHGLPNNYEWKPNNYEWQQGPPVAAECCVLDKLVLAGFTAAYIYHPDGLSKRYLMQNKRHSIHIYNPFCTHRICT